MPYSSKGRATGYTDYYKGRDRTPSGSYDDEEDGQNRSFSVNISIPTSNRSQNSTAEERKAALRRRLMKQRKAGR